MAFGADESKLVSIFIQTLLYGAYTVVFALTIWILVWRHPEGQSINKLMLWTSIVMFTLATMHIGVNYARIFLAFITYRNAEGGPAAFFNILSNFTQVFGSAIYVAQTLVGDSVVLVRCYIVWGRQWYIVAFPMVLLLGSTASGIGILYSFAHIGDAQVFAVQLQDWIVSFFSLTLSTNVICTTLVAYRIWYVNRSIMNFTHHSWNPVMLLVIESGAIYSATLLSLLILYKTESWFQYVLLDAISPIVGLVFSMIIVRIGLGLMTPYGETRPSKFTFPSTSRGTRQSASYNMHHLGPFVAAQREGNAGIDPCNTSSVEDRLSTRRSEAAGGRKAPLGLVATVSVASGDSV
ncbi:hypothetical protein EV361DRAFT_622033 [Lentinula raphanica]|uniref:Uncharacterized protein n=1 Tax=Lentinula raphanica TaxID=153919 RepID=A0AA38UH56_9AGAR|nr:hypothetical protein F5878DRAFT_454449 [Lentinula raphanica]KAJ3977581.1 hypothetical protein EV361DRAFT_622033 [Lentinula raphanica]